MPHAGASLALRAPHLLLQNAGKFSVRSSRALWGGAACASFAPIWNLRGMEGRPAEARVRVRCVRCEHGGLASEPACACSINTSRGFLNARRAESSAGGEQSGDPPPAACTARGRRRARARAREHAVVRPFLRENSARARTRRGAGVMSDSGASFSAAFQHFHLPSDALLASPGDAAVSDPGCAPSGVRRGRRWSARWRRC